MGGCPNVIGYCKKHEVNPDSWLEEPFMNWGMVKQPYISKDGYRYPGHRSVMLVAIKLLIILGFRRIYLLGADFNMQPDKPYSFKEHKTEKECAGNNNTYIFLNAFLNDMREEFDLFGIKIYNCTKESRLNAFPYKKFEDAIEVESRQMYTEYLKEDSTGMYIPFAKKLETYNLIDKEC
jgi:hypothetical protein